MKSATERLTLQGRAGEIAGRVLDAGDILQFVQPFHRVDRHIDNRTRRNIVDDDGKTNGIVDRLEMAVEALLRRLIVIGRDDEKAVGAGAFRETRQFDRFLRIVRTRPGDDGNAALGLADTGRDHFTMLLMRKRGTLPGRADRHKPMRAVDDLPIRQGAESRLVETAVLKRRDKRGEGTLESRLIPHRQNRLSEIRPIARLSDAVIQGLC